MANEQSCSVEGNCNLEGNHQRAASAAGWHAEGCQADAACRSFREFFPVVRQCAGAASAAGNQGESGAEDEKRWHVCCLPAVARKLHGEEGDGG